MMNNYKDFYKFATDVKIDGRYVSGLRMDDYLKKQRPLVNHSLITDHQSVTIAEDHPTPVALMDVFSKMIQNNIIFIEDINQETADIICAQLLYLSNVNDGKNIEIYTNSYGGECYAGGAIVSTMSYIPNTISTVCMGICASYGAVILSAGDFGRRYIQPNGTVMLHQPLGGASGPAADIRIMADEIDRLKKYLFEFLAARTGHTYDEVVEYCLRDRWMDAQEALDFHIVDKILEPSPLKIQTYKDYIKSKESEA